MKKLEQSILSNPYKGYMYSYPHKKAYSNFYTPIDIKKLWKERKESLILYVHIPFCMHKCGYCNLFSTTHFDEERLNAYIDQLIKEMKSIQNSLDFKKGKSPFQSVIFGGGTPTVLKNGCFEKLLKAIESIFYVNWKETFFSVESSPTTLTKEKIELLKQYHINRVSMGIQSFYESELKKIYRQESMVNIKDALKRLFKENMDIRNLDLIYGIPTQTLKTWEDSLKKALDYEPEEMYIYPLYIREKTGLYKRYHQDNEMKMRMYDLACNIFSKKGYIQTSMRNFVRKDKRQVLFPEYSCQENQMIGIGCGARSYIGNVHYSKKYAVDPTCIHHIIEDYLEQKDFSKIDYGYILNEDELKRRYIIKSISKVSGLNIDEYEKKFHESIMDAYKEVDFLLEQDFLRQENQFIYPTKKGLKYSDAIGTLFISKEVKQKIKKFKE